MLGLLFFSLFGWVDLEMVYVNPTFMTSAIVGGAIMGAGFILGGFCPGTSVCGAAIGKIDAIVFVGGLFIGVLIFTEGYPLWESLYQVLNHSTDHRAQTLAQIYRVGGETIAQDFVYYTWEKPD